METNLKYGELSKKVIRVFYEVYNELGNGFLESVYENAMYHILSMDLGLDVHQQCPVTVYFRNKPVGVLKVDLLVEDKILVELKAVAKLSAEHEAQIINYLKSTGKEVGLLVNFGNKPTFRRFIFDKQTQ